MTKRDDAFFDAIDEAVPYEIKTIRPHDALRWHKESHLHRFQPIPDANGNRASRRAAKKKKKKSK